ncbi:MAG: hypothetical protein AB7J13_06225 [Pyrinomonadaceae bacterium]
MLKAAGIGGSVLVVIALVIALLKVLITFVGFISMAVKLLIVLAFILVFASVAFMIFRAWQTKRKADH